MEKRMTRDNFYPEDVIKELKRGKIPRDEANRLLEESCHALARYKSLAAELQTGIFLLNQHAEAMRKILGPML